MRTRKREKGMALLLVLVIVALLTSLLTDLAFSTLVDLRLTETFRDSTKAYYLAKGGVNAGRMILQRDINQYDSLDEPWSRGVANYPVGDGSVSVFIADQDGRLAINSMVSLNNPQPVMVDRFYRLLLAIDFEEEVDPAELTAALIDWLDLGDEPFTEIRTDDRNIPVAGAEEIYYRSLSPPYDCKNGPIETLEELTLVKGFTPEIVRQLAPHLTVNGLPRININTATTEVLMSLDQSIDWGVAERIIDYRQREPIAQITDLEDVITAEIYSVLKTLANIGQLGTTSDIYRIEATAVVNDGQRRLDAIVNKSENRLLFFKVN
jgi:general secretion pathway protein K